MNGLKSFVSDHDSEIVMAVMVGAFLYMSFSTGGGSQGTGFRLNKSTNCSIEYSSTRCVEGSLVTAFHNPCEKRLEEVKMRVSNGRGGWNVYDPGKPLKPNSTKYLTTGGCESQVESRKVVSYCFEGECGSEEMDNPSEDLELKR